MLLPDFYFILQKNLFQMPQIEGLWKNFVHACIDALLLERVLDVPCDTYDHGLVNSEYVALVNQHLSNFVSALNAVEDGHAEID